MESSASPPEPPSPTPPKATADVLLGKYELGRLLGRGSFAKVYQATSLSTKATVAIKVLDKAGLSASGASPDMVLREVTAMRRLRHPNILRLHEVLATRSKIYLVMDHAAGGDLLSRLARRPGSRLPEPVARRYFQQLAAALRFCHARGVHHRDVKPQNLLLLDRRGDHLALADFGLSALPDQLSPAGLLRTACGTPAFAAPELSRRRPYDGAKADAWSCGVILFVLLSGSLPFDDRNLALMYRKMSQRDYRFPPWFPPAARTVVSRLLDPDPETRFTIDRALELPWFRRAYSLDHRLDLLGALQPPLAAAEEEESTIDGENHHHPLASSMNAFDIISLSAGLDLSGLFDEGAKGGRRRFSSTEKVERVMERIEEVVGGKFGYSVKRRKGGVLVGLGRWGSVVSVEVAEVAPPLVLVELRVEDGGGGGKVGEEFCWKELRSELDDIVFAWHGGTGVDV